MSTRERWIVYPLLFLTLGITMRLALHDKISPPTSLQIEEIVAGQIHCNKLLADQGVVAKQVQTDGIIAGGVQCGGLQVVGPNGRPTVLVVTDPKTKGGLITTLSPAGAPLVLLQPTDSGGVVVASECVKGSGVPSGKPKTPSAPSPKQPSKEPEKRPPNAAP